MYLKPITFTNFHQKRRKKNQTQIFFFFINLKFYPILVCGVSNRYDISTSLFLKHYTFPFNVLLFVSFSNTIPPPNRKFHSSPLRNWVFRSPVRPAIGTPGKMFSRRILGHFIVFFFLYLFFFPSPSLSFPFPKKHKHKIDGPIKTVVVLIMENRSFDHVLGWLKRYRPEIDGLTGSEFNRINASDPNSQKFFATDDALFVDSDPGHSIQAIREQIFGSDDASANPAPMNGFVQQAESMGVGGMSKNVMSGFKPEVLPVYTELANEFAVFDKWFASVPASTQPNRFYVHSATSHGASSNVRKDLIHGFPQKTIFDSLDENDLSFGIYFQNIPATLFFKSLRKLKHVVKFHDYALKFKLHAKLGKLPNYAVIEQRYFDVNLFPANDDHPSHDMALGQKFVKEVYEILRASPQWKEMALLITYDEHGGFYDHVPTPVEGVPNPDGIIGPDPWYFRFDRLGVRVPTFLISPWIDKGTGKFSSGFYFNFFFA